MTRLWITLALLSLTLSASAHPLRPALLRLTAVDSQPEQLDVTLKVPSAGDRMAPLEVVFPDHCRAIHNPVMTKVTDGVLRRWRIDCEPGGIQAGPITFTGLSRKVGEVLVIHDDGQGSVRSVVARADAPEAWLHEGDTRGAWSYLPLGIEHILLGIDHLLFVLGLMILVFGRATGASARLRLLVTITAFTAAHSLTLAAATLGLVQVPSDAVETVIALSILLLAVEIARPEDAPLTWTARRPAVVAFAFGLLHGFGFAGALTSLGLPEGGIASALLMFNVGVELGQLAFVAAILAIALPLARLSTTGFALTRTVTVHAIGGLAAYWCLDRGAALLERVLSSSG